MRWSIVRCACAALVLAVLATAGRSAGAERPSAATFEPLHFALPENDCRAQLDVVCNRLGWPAPALKETREKSGSKIPNAPVRTEETFQAIVPKTYRPGAKGWGILVWISPSENAELPPDWLDVLRERRLILVSADHSGNERVGVWRMALALQAVAKMKKTHPTDPRRTYIAGRASGGSVASMLGIAFPDVFSGGIYVNGCNFYRDIHLPGKPGRPSRTWPKAFDPPSVDLLRQAKNARGHALLSEPSGASREQMRAVYQMGFKQHGFKRAVLVESPKLEGGIPSAALLDKALGALLMVR